MGGWRASSGPEGRERKSRTRSTWSPPRLINDTLQTSARTATLRLPLGRTSQDTCMPLGGQALGPLEAQREMGDVLRPSTSSLADLPSPPSANDVPPAPGIPGNVCVVNGKRFNFIDTTVPVLIIGYLG